MKKIIIVLAMTVIMISGYSGKFYDLGFNNTFESNTNDTTKDTVADDTETNDTTTDDTITSDITTSDVITFETTQGTVELEHRSVLSDEIDILLPVEFEEMSEAMIKAKYPAGDRPKLVFTNDAANVNVAFNLTENECKEEDIQMYYDILKESAEDGTLVKEWISDGVEDQNGMTIAKMEFVTMAIDTDIYNLMYLVSLDDKLLICSFNSTIELKDDWMPIAEEIMGSIKKK